MSDKFDDALEQAMDDKVCALADVAENMIDEQLDTVPKSDRALYEKGTVIKTSIFSGLNLAVEISNRRKLGITYDSCDTMMSIAVAFDDWMNAPEREGSQDKRRDRLYHLAQHLQMFATEKYGQPPQAPGQEPHLTMITSLEELEEARKNGMPEPLYLQMKEAMEKIVGSAASPDAPEPVKDKDGDAVPEKKKMH